MDQKIVGERLKELRIQVALSQAKLVAAIGDIKQPVYARYERGDIFPSYPVLVKLADYFDVSADYLLGRTDNPHGKYFGKATLSQSEQIDDFIEMCFEPNTEANNKLKQALKTLMEEQR